MNDFFEFIIYVKLLLDGNCYSVKNAKKKNFEIIY